MTNYPKIIKILFHIVLIVLFIHSDLNVSACTIFTASSKNIVLVGNNEDMCTTNTEIHLIPSTNDKYGRIFWGFIGDENYQGGMNEHGLFFDGAGTQEIFMSKSDLPEFKGRYIMETILEKCETVSEAIEYLKKYSHPSLRYGHDLIADANGDAVIVEWGNDKLNFISKDDKNFLIATNFNITESKNVSNECERYNIAQNILSKEQVSVTTFEKILSLTHQEGDFGTVYSNICDLTNKKVYLYNFHNYVIKKEIDLITELKNGEIKYRIRDLFPTNYAENYFRMRQDCISDFDNAPTNQVDFKVESKTSFPNCRIYLRGSAIELGRWNKEGIDLIRNTDYLFSKSLDFKKGALIEYELAIENKEYYPIDENKNRLKEMVLEIESDTTIVIKINDWIKK
jgi:predicted choloylglycine hydrolase